MFALLVGAALAHECSQAFLIRTLPEDGEGQVPVNMAPALLEQACADSFRLELAAEGQPLVREERAGGPLVRMAEQDLLPDTLYTLTVAPADEPSWTDSVQFTTGAAQAEPGQAPEITAVEVGAWGAATLWLEGRVEVALAVDDPLGVVVLLDSSGDVEQVARAVSPVEFAIDEEYDGDVFCARVAVDDASGRRAHAEPVCVEPEVQHLDEFMDPEPADSGCSTGPAALAWGWLLLLLARRR